MDLSPDSKLTRRQAAHALTSAGYPTAEPTLATKATRGGGPPYELYGRRPIYTWGPTLAWAESRLSPPVGSSAQAGRVAGPAASVAVDDHRKRSRGRPEIAERRERVAGPRRIADPVDAT
jgi:hypothetical protein